MAFKYNETKTDEIVALLEKAVKAKPSDKKTRTDVHKKASTQIKEFQKRIADAASTHSAGLEKLSITLMEALGVATSEVKLFERAIVRHLRRAVKRSKDIPKPKGWTDGYDKAVKSITAWDPKGDSVAELKECAKLLEAARKHIQTEWDAYTKGQLECNDMIDEAIGDLKTIDDARVKGLLDPYFDRLRALCGE